MLQADPSLAEVHGCSTEQLESLARSIELKKQRLEADINAYITKKQSELAQFEQQLLAQYREMECGDTRKPAHRAEKRVESQSSSAPSGSVSPLSQSPTGPIESKPEEKAKRTKVYKREKELFGLVTPIFLPLLDASKEKDKKKRQKKKEETSVPTSNQPSPVGHVEPAKKTQGSSSKPNTKMDSEQVSTDPKEEGQQQNYAPETAIKPKMPTTRKSSLRHSGEKQRRKRVSLVIDGQTVLPADQVTEPPLMSPSETTASSTSNSIASLEDAIDPRLMGGVDATIDEHEHHDAMHHSIDLPNQLPSTSPTKHTGHTLPESPTRSPTYQSPPSHLESQPPQTATRTFLDPSPPRADVSIPRFASATPIYASVPELANPVEEDFATYVGGIEGSGVDDVDQTGSLGYPASLGASYMESYMKSRPLSVRMAAAEKAGLSDEERRRLINNGRTDDDVDFATRDTHMPDVDEGMEIMGSMEDF